MAVNLAESFVERGHLVSIITVEKDAEEYDVPKGVYRYNLHSRRKTAKIFELRKKLIELQYDTVITMCVPNSVYVIPATRGLNYTVIVSERSDPTRFSGKKSTKIISRLLLKKANGCVFQTQRVKEYYAKRKINGCVIGNPLTDAIARDNRKPTLQGDIIAVGRLSPPKNYPLMINAFKKVVEVSPKEKLSIYGAGKLHDELMTLINQTGLSENVFLHGNIKNIYDVYLNAKAYVLTSDYEGIPNSLLEALAAGLPCVATDCESGGCRELIESVNGGMLVDLGKDDEVAEAILYNINNPRNLDVSIAQMKNIRELYSIDRIADEWLEYIMEKRA